jgi:hypothetical protein
MSVVAVDLYDPDELERWVSYLNRPASGSYDRVVAYEDIGEAYPDVFEKPRLSNYAFFLLTGAALMAVTVVVIWVFVPR